jgi:hypothetical protein
MKAPTNAPSVTGAPTVTAPPNSQVLGSAQTVTQEPAKPPVTPPQPATELPGLRVETGGFLTEFVRAEDKRAFFNLKTPIDTVKDYENLWYYPRTPKVQGVVLFSVKF